MSGTKEKEKEHIWSRKELLTWLDRMNRLKNGAAATIKHETTGLHQLVEVHTLLQAEKTYQTHLEEAQNLLRGKERLLLAIEQNDMEDTALALLIIREARKNQSSWLDHFLGKRELPQPDEPPQSDKS